MLLIVLVMYPLVWPQAPYLDADSDGYRVVAADMADGRLDQLHFRSPGYPFVLLLTGSTTRPTRSLFFLGLALHFISTWVAAAVLYRLGVAARFLNLFGVLLSLPPFVEPAAHVLSENLTEFLLVLSFAAVFGWLCRRKAGYAVATGLLIAAAALVRPTFQLAALAIALLLLLLTVVPRIGVRVGDAVRMGLTAFCVSALGIGAFATYNYVQFGVSSISPGNLSYSMTTKTVRLLERIPDKYAVEREILIAARDQHLVKRGSSHTAEQYWPTAVRELERVTGKTNLELLDLMSRINFLLIREAPLQYLWEVFRSVPNYWWPAITPLSYGSSSLGHFVWAGLHFVWIGFFVSQLVVLGGVSLLALTRQLRARLERLPGQVVDVDQLAISSYLLALTLIVYTMLISCTVHHGEARYRAPTDVFIVFLCFVGARIWWRWAQPDRQTQRTHPAR